MGLELLGMARMVSGEGTGGRGRGSGGGIRPGMGKGGGGGSSKRMAAQLKSDRERENWRKEKKGTGLAGEVVSVAMREAAWSAAARVPQRGPSHRRGEGSRGTGLAGFAWSMARRSGAEESRLEARDNR